MVEPSDTLIQDCLAGKPSAQRQVYQQLLPYFRAVAKRYLRSDLYLKDVLQETFVKLFRSLDRYDSSKGSLKTYGSRILVNACLNHNERRAGPTTESWDSRLHDRPENLNPTEIQDEKLRWLLRKMPADYATVFNLSVIDGYDHEEIAEMLGIKASLSRKRLSRARSWLATEGQRILNEIGYP